MQGIKTDEAKSIIEALRKGIPPNCHIRQFTVGHELEIDNLRKELITSNGFALMIKADYGTGKTHLLHFIREEALNQNYAVSFVTLNSKAAVRFNRMDQIVGAVCSNIEIPNSQSCRSFF